MEFEDKVNKVVCDTFYKEFDECKRKVVEAFHLLDLQTSLLTSPKRWKEEWMLPLETSLSKLVKPSRQRPTRTLLRSPNLLKLLD